MPLSCHALSFFRDLPVFIELEQVWHAKLFKVLVVSSPDKGLPSHARHAENDTVIAVKNIPMTM